MNIPIELIVIFFLIVIVTAWVVWFKFSNKRNVRRYNPDDDKGRLAEEARNGQIVGREQSFESTALDIPEPSGLKGRELLSPTTSDNSVELERNNGEEQSVPRETGISIGKTKLRSRNPFRRRRK